MTKSFEKRPLEDSIARTKPSTFDFTRNNARHQGENSTMARRVAENRAIAESQQERVFPEASKPDKFLLGYDKGRYPVEAGIILNEKGERLNAHSFLTEQEKHAVSLYNGGDRSESSLYASKMSAFLKRLARDKNYHYVENVERDLNESYRNTNEYRRLFNQT